MTSRIILFFLLACLLSQAAFSQKPSPKEIEAQKAEAARDARKQMEEMEKQIAEAKARNEDPATIKELEEQLALVKKMLGVIEKAGTSASNRPQKLPPPTEVEPKYVSPFVPIVLKQPVVAPKEAQAKDHLLWYRGKKIDANTLITTNSTVVRYDRQRNILLFQPEQRVDSPDYYVLVRTLAQIPQMRTEFAFQMNGIMNSFLSFPLIQQAYDEFGFFRERFYEMAKNSTEINVTSRLTNFDLAQKVQALQLYIASLQSPANIKIPPKRPSNLCVCNPKDRKKYEEDLENWSEAFWSDEAGIFFSIKEIYGHLDQLVQAHQPIHYPIPNFQEEMTNAFNEVIERAIVKIDELAKKYEAPNIYLEEGLIMALKYLQKQIVIVGNRIGSTNRNQSTRDLKREVYAQFDRIKGLLMNNTVFEKYIEEQMRLRNYNVVFDKSLYMAHELNKQVLDRSYKANKGYFGTWEDKLYKFNRFTLSIHLNFQYENVDVNTNELILTANGVLESDKITVSLQRTECEWSLRATDVDHKDRSSDDEKFHIPFNVRGGTKVIFSQTKPITFQYTGPSKMYMIFPLNNALSFCPGTGYREYVSMDVLRFNNSDLQTYANDFAAGAYSLDMNQYVDKMFISILKTKINADQLSTTADLMLSIQSQVQTPPSSGNQSMDEMKMIYLFENKRSELMASRVPTTHTSNTVIPFDALNGDPIIISKTHDTVDRTDPDWDKGIRLTRGLITLKVEHTPL
jgi:hypothetical protein